MKTFFFHFFFYFIFGRFWPLGQNRPKFFFGQEKAVLATESRQKWSKKGFDHFWSFLTKIGKRLKHVFGPKIALRGTKLVLISTDLLIWDDFASRKIIEMCLNLGTKSALKGHF